MNTDKNIIAYTDGSFRKELQMGGWSAVIINDNKKSEYSKCGFATSGSVAELKAIILALENTPVNSNVTIYSDAKSHIDVIQSLILSDNKSMPSKNGDLWQYITGLISTRNVSCAWIKGHSGIEGNVRANQLAYQALFEFKDYPLDKVVEELIFVKIPTKYKEKKLLLKRVSNFLKILKKVIDGNTMLQLQKKKQLLKNAIAEHKNLKRNGELKRRKKENGQLPKKEKIKCVSCDKLFRSESYRDQHIKDKHRSHDYFICCYSGIKLIVE